ncbi:uracil-DNA glycosylase [Listeria newyorkensis]|uniref:Uracil-DNA glycosylase n=1 Tax=Listeria newyorkensis TaxID=1497681 RepID=A0ABX4XI85_9LIST|nr:uracil-DNA glycosylase [Listeria newyorkensis]PNP87478.1 uracil-DNA glycosylase [Listeria newyorkensis]WAO20511.1 uracil-DNA glycosylase [Listeria newyorkensis]SQC56701.1 Uracil-DNA glycosylase [Listeria newyorkensis]
MQNDWQALLKEEQEKAYFQDLQRFVEEEYETATVYPPREAIYHALDLTSYADTKVVILGQDPYHGPNQAHGLSFSVASSEAKFPPSVRNMFKELDTDLGVSRTDINLTDWAEQGVLLLNTVLTVQAGKAASHRKKGWEQFTDSIIRLLNEKEEQVIFVLWGADAKKKQVLITNPQHKVITAVHPSPLSAYNGFFGSKPYSQINAYLESAGKAPISW